MAQQLTDAEARQVIMTTTQLRMTAPYQEAEAIRRAKGAETMAMLPDASREQAAVRLLIGTWERIAMFAQDFSEAQRDRFFRCHPVALVWSALGPAVLALRENGQVGPRFGAELEHLAGLYRQWTETKAGAEYRTEAQQTVCALFA